MASTSSFYTIINDVYDATNHALKMVLNYIHTHVSDTQGGLLDHGTAHTSASLADNDHTQYVLHTEVDDTPVDGVTTDPVSSNWAFDHNASSAKHLDALLTTKGDVAAFTTVPVRIPVGTNDYLLTADSAVAAGVKWAAAINTYAGLVDTAVVPKTADETVTNSSTLQNDDELLFAVAANEVYLITLCIRQNSSAVGDFKYAFAVPANSSIFRVSTYLGDAAEVDGTTAVGLVGRAANAYAFAFYYYIGGDTAGNVQLQWAQETQDASDAKLLDHSFIIAQRTE